MVVAQEEGAFGSVTATIIGCLLRDTSLRGGNKASLTAISYPINGWGSLRNAELFGRRRVPGKLDLVNKYHSYQERYQAPHVEKSGIFV